MKKNKKLGWSKRKRIIVMVLSVYALFYIGVILLNTYKKLPEGVSYEGDLHWTDEVEMFTDLTYAKNKEGDSTVHELAIFDEVYAMIDRAEQFIVLDYFLFDHYYDEDIEFPKIVQTMTKKLVEKKQNHPDMPIIFITDPLNTGYGSYETEWFTKMEDAGIEVIYTDLEPLRDSIPIYSGLYRSIFHWMDFEKTGWIANAMSSKAPKMTLASYITLLNVKANHRKTVVTDKEALVSSGNPHNASGFHGNVALKVKGDVLNDILEAEEAVVNFTNGGTLPRVEVEEQDGGNYAVQYLTEKKILDGLLGDIAKAQEGDTIRVGMFFIAKRDLVNALIDAANRGVDVKMILDPNENSFGNEKSGLPN
ncbi:MAG TPA: phospholipase D-like domain-containing protein, partial [Sporosarcina psychrophila]|nr:phospholipase D-like domain-containing protein [Sporosarcina psychrophila]